ncbi:hypothetical protein AB0G15_07100 [Streptosporangium sp. NPDC023825]|uniref:hypothetical protein n=1 Tax=Streptosporangium sp. NPDC023825 TaxID=3154909 RepID=UPI0034255BF6
MSLLSKSRSGPPQVARSPMTLFRKPNDIRPPLNHIGIETLSRRAGPDRTIDSRVGFNSIKDRFKVLDVSLKPIGQYFLLLGLAQ